MASFMNRSSRIASLILFGLFLAGCEGNDGAPGAEGPAGPPGQPGDPGPSTGGGVPVDSAERINIAVTAIDVPDGNTAPEVSLTLTNDLNQGLFGLPAGDIRFVLSQLTPGTAGGSSEWQSYKTREDGGIEDVQATTETAVPDRFEDNGDGTYTYTFANAPDDYPAGPVFDADKIHRLGIEIRDQAPISSNGIVTFLPSTSGPPAPEDDARRIVDNDTCNACHDRLEFHGGPRTDVEYCVSCHNPYSIDGDTGNTVDMKALIHNIHVGRDGYRIIGHNDREHDFSDVKWTQDVRNCQTCHEENDTDTPQASNWRLVQNRAACGTCHYDDGVPGNNNDFAIEDGIHPFGLVFTDDTQCAGCHGPDSTVDGGRVQVARIHEIPEQLASGLFQYNVISIANAAVGQTPSVTFSVVNPGDPDDPNDDVPYDLATDPAWTACDGTSRLAVTLAWTTDDYINTGSGNTPAQPVSINPLTGPGCGGTADDNGDGTYTVTSPVAVPAGITGTLSAGIEGHPWVDINGDGATARNERIAVTNAVDYQGIDGADTVARRNAIAIERCDQCHNQLSIHGNNRTDEPEVCVQCHNPNATDINRRVAGSECDIGRPPGTDGPDDPGVPGLGLDDQTIDFKRMIHRIHSSGYTDVPFGVCGFGNSAHVFDVTYPGHLNNCEGCHLPPDPRNDKYPYHPVEAGTIQGTTVDVGADLASPTDDVVISPNSSVCSSCHVSSLAKTHMEQNGGNFAATKNPDGSLNPADVESCALCHGPGRSADVAEVHGVAGFEFN
jgi:OmcA/MtrC family decaheme c-type cytochrome